MTASNLFYGHTKNPDKAAALAFKSAEVTFKNVNKIFFPDDGYTKGDLIAYYQTVAPYLLPHLLNRPLALKRQPDGITDEGFFQKNVAGLVPKWLQTIQIKAESNNKIVEWLVCTNLDALLFMVNLGCIEINPWLSHWPTLDQPDYVIFDLDPNQNENSQLITTALQINQLLKSNHIQSFIKTSGAKGLHIYIPLKSGYSFLQARSFAKKICEQTQKALPKITSIKRNPRERISKIYLDYLQNAKGKTMASAYCVRPYPGAPVSTPLEWDEVNSNLNLKAFNMKTIQKRLQEKGDLWAHFFDQSSKQVIPASFL